MKRLLVSLVFSVLVVGCASPTYSPDATDGVPSSSATTAAGVLPSECTYVESHITSAGETVPASYQCSGSSPARYSGGSCRWVSSYVRQDGTAVAGHTRCLERPTTIAPSYTPSGSGGPVNVRGYHRKDGTYVKPHTRSRSGSRRR